MRINKTEEKIIIGYILGSEENIPEYLKIEAENYYFSCCLLMPTDNILMRIEELGGFEIVLNNQHFQQYLANFYKVPLNSLFVRITSLYHDNLEKQTNKNKKTYEKNKTFNKR